MRESHAVFYPVLLTHSETRGWHARVPDFPQVRSTGASKAEALSRATEAVVTVIDDFVKARRPIPEGFTSPVPGEAVRVPALVAAKIALHNEMRRRGLRKSAMRKRLQWHRPQIDRLLDVRYASKMDQVEKAFDALGLELVVAARPTTRRA
jgi:antitoxin HicB